MFPTVPQPLGGGSADDHPFPLDNFPTALAEILECVAEDLGVPKELVVGPFLGVANTAQGRGVIRVNNAWAEPGPIYSLTAATTGARKTAVLRAARDPLIAIQAELERETRGDVAMAQARLDAQVDRVKALKNQLSSLGKATDAVSEFPTADVGANPDVNVTQVEAALQRELDILGEMQETLPSSPKLWFDDPTSEKLHDIIAEHPHAGIMIAEARDYLVKMMKGDVQLKSFLSAYSMETNSRDLVSRNVRSAIEPSMAAVLVTQTAFLRQILRNAELWDSGFLDRFLTLWVPRFLPPPVEVLRADQLQSRGLRNTSQADRMWDRYIRWEVRRTFPLGRETLTFGIGDDHAARRLDLHLEEVYARQNDGGSGAELGHGTILHKLGGQALRYARLCAQFRLDPPDFSAPMETQPALLDPSRIYPIGAKDVDAGFDTAWHSFRNVGQVLTLEFDQEEVLEQRSLAVLTVAKELVETDPQFDYILNARIVMRKRSKVSAAELEWAFTRLIETGWVRDVTSQIPRARSRHVVVRPDFLVWLLEYGYVETRDAPDSSAGTAA